MTGFGNAARDAGAARITVDMKSVNHRFLDVAWRLPAVYSSREPILAKILRERLRRGRVEVTVTRTAIGTTQGDVRFDAALFDRYLTAMRDALERAGVKSKSNDPSLVLQLLQRREILDAGGGEDSVENELPVLDELVAESVGRLIGMRVEEGRALERDISQLLAALESTAERIAVVAADTPQQFSERLRARLQRLQPEVEVDPMRLAQEVAILADRVDVSEELARLNSHIAQFRTIMGNEEAGKKLDFLLQELGREINTTGSKAQSSEIAKLVVDAKATLEKIREQVQNVE